MNTFLKLLITAGIAFGAYTFIVDGNIIEITDRIGTVPEDKSNNTLLGSNDFINLKEKIKESDSFKGEITYLEDLQEELDKLSVNEIKDNFEDITIDDIKEIGLKDVVDFVKPDKDKEDRNLPAENLFSDSLNDLPDFTSACFSTFTQACIASDCSNKTPNSSFTLLNKTNKKIFKCETDTCIEINAEYEVINNFETYQPTRPEGIIINKEISNESDQSLFVEIRVEGMSTELNYGYCLGQ
ncbi:MAG: hypothetical protein WDZ80_05945 [Candidatus Paceibacterota bacterium]